MKKSIIYKVLNICILIIVISICTSNIIYGAVTDVIDPTDTAVDDFKNPISIILGITQVIAIGVAAIMLVALAIKYMSAAPGDKAEIKQHAIIYLVGACIAFGYSGLVEIFKGAVKEMLE